MKKILLVAVVTLPFLTSCSLTGNNKTDDVYASSASSSCVSSSDYKANGKNYRALEQIANYRADGVAVIYREKVQGSQTTGCESFDMNGFTAAHRTLPLPTHIKITNKNNGKSVVVKVNDRGPATGNSLLQVTPATANVLGASSNFPVHIEALNTTHLATTSGTSRVAPINYSVTGNANTSALAIKSKQSIDRSQSDRYFIIVGTYQTNEDALDRFVRVSSIGIANVAMETRKLKGRTLHMVRIGPYYEQDKIDQTKDRLRSDGLIKFKVVKN